MTLYKNFLLKRGVGLFSRAGLISGDYGIKNIIKNIKLQTGITLTLDHTPDRPKDRPPHVSTCSHLSNAKVCAHLLTSCWHREVVRSVLLIDKCPLMTPWLILSRAYMDANLRVHCTKLWWFANATHLFACSEQWHRSDPQDCSCTLTSLMPRS